MGNFGAIVADGKIACFGSNCFNFSAAESFCFFHDVFKERLGKFDRIIVAMPTFGVAFVPELLKAAKQKAFLHVLDFAAEEDLDFPARRLQELCQKNKRVCKVLRTVKAGQPGVRKYRVCVDAVF